MIRTRFAPSPTGLMHLGNARTALFAYLLARTDKDGVFVLRFEDTDKKRSERYYEDAIIEDLRWLGIRVNEGAGYGGSLGPYRQSERLAAHRTAVNHLLDIDRAYPCYCTAEELEAERQMAITARRTPRYSGRCRDLTDADRAKFDAEGRLPAIRFRQKMDGEVIGFEDALRGPYNFVTDDLDDFIIQRSDGTVSFLLASALDDADMKITHVVRGEDHLSNTPRQVQLLRTLERSVPQYWHLGLLMGPDQKPLSKRHGSATVADLREAGYEPEAVVSCLARMGWNPPEEWSGNPMDVFAKAFDAQGISPAPSVWDEARLDHDNAHVLRTMPTDRLVERIRDLLPKLTWTERERDALEAIKPELKNR
ncbi:glutamate--tRNA ligase, partial [bacterium]|nr:glutamate--tRNA ligase [bacterium]